MHCHLNIKNVFVSRDSKPQALSTTFAKEKKNMDATTATGNEETISCPVCAETIKKAALKCRFCGADLREAAANQAASEERLLFKGHPAPVCSAWQWLLVIATLGIAYLVYWVRSLAATYEITSQRIRIERGLLSTAKDSVELFTIEHFDIKKPLGMRLAGHCILQLRSSDSSFSSFSLYGIPGLETIADAMRECSLRERKRRQVVSVIRP
jgi:hypothetical protein